MKIRLTQLTNSLNIPHMKYSRLLTAIMMLTGVLTACSDQENEQDGANERTALSINAGIRFIVNLKSDDTYNAHEDHEVFLRQALLFRQRIRIFVKSIT